jgi:3-oxoadipate enol-lactonase
MPLLEVPSAQLHYEIWGEDAQPTIVLVNGHTRPLNDFRTLGKSLVAAGWRVVAFDNRGSGRTIYEGSFSLHDMVDDLYAVTTQLCPTPPVVLGVSMGGMIAQSFACQRAKAISALILISTAPHSRYFTGRVKKWQENADEILAQLRFYVSSDYFGRNDVLMKSMAKQMSRSFAEAAYAEGARLQREATQAFDCEAALLELRVPTLILHGSKDEILHPDGALQMNRAIAGSQLVIQQGHGHLLLVEDFSGLSESILRFLPSVTGQAKA